MKLLYSGIHKNIGFIIQKTGGYDQEYHIDKLAKKLNINREDISILFTESRRSNLYHYIELLENGMCINKVFEMIDKDNQISSRNARKTLAFMNSFIANSPYRGML